ncbi:hypothetical protein [Burkholderia cepacia]|uniref:Uncharacterized protein n=1 Tax=Burkholderia cepacia GG4 TaxID=1009846 RepID=A0A9W3K8D9_BURCE|nr:hypothetical protein [Burkholderia cepacia]AFQ52175.1 hypothetical protein GEM_5791 [Burkholderia cepacia GG4]
MNHNLTTRASEPVLREDALPDDENPLLANLPPVPSIQEALHMVAENYLEHDVTGLSDAEIVIRQSKHAIVPNSQFARVLVHVIAQARDSYRDRDLRKFDYRRHVLTTNNFLHHRPSARAHYKIIPSCAGIAPRAKARGMVVAVPAYMGRTVLCEAIQSFLQRELVSARVTVGEGLAEYPQLRVLRVPWPIKGDPGGLITNFISAIDSALNTDYLNSTRFPWFRERDGIPAICSLGTAVHLGLLIVDRINVENVTSSAADHTWNVIAQFTRTTGIPVICLPTPGAAALSLARLSGSLSDLTSAGVLEISPPLNARNSHWIAICETQFAATMGVAGIGEMPAWLPEDAYALTQGYPGLLAKVLTGIAQHLLIMKVTSFDRKLFDKYGKSSLVMDQPHIDAIRSIRERPSKFRPSSLMRHGDWLSFEELFSTHLMPEPL